jgi:hypothetical protein
VIKFFMRIPRGKRVAHRTIAHSPMQNSACAMSNDSAIAEVEGLQVPPSYDSASRFGGKPNDWPTSSGWEQYSSVVLR